MDFDFDPFFAEKNVVRELRIGLLLAFFSWKLWKKLPSGLFGGFLGGDANGASGLQVTKGGGDFAPIAELKGALAETAISDESHSVSDAAINFDKGNNALAIGDGIVNAEFLEAEHRQADSEDLAGTEVAVSNSGEFKIFGQRFHGYTVIDEFGTQKG